MASTGLDSLVATNTDGTANTSRLLRTMQVDICAGIHDTEHWFPNCVLQTHDYFCIPTVS
jgi:hypothetical protein